ncbi:MAG: serine hydrolase [Candidatus Accumulibacter sp.]|uniref:serine hydrolase n=1 Tax=Accumulibacter sp. TaxID=2053492 RepID=UPI0025855B9A|nr:serine hydrolase [Accumulibacter sp.]MCM8623314.1 serine hydrolase [Accumulibacter sp.]
MRHWLTLLALMVPWAWTLHAAEECVIEPVTRSTRDPGAWIDQDNWLAPENLRIGLQSFGRFMPSLKIRATETAQMLRPASRQLELDKLKARDPLDQQPRDVGFLLATRLYADGLLVLRDGKVASERYWNGLVAQDQRLLLGGTRPILSLMGAMAVAQGKLSPDRSIIRYIPALSGQTGLRKLSIRRLLEGESSFDWSSNDVSDWLAAGGWNTGNTAEGIRAWLNQPGRWDRDFSPNPQLGEVGPDSDLLVWALAEAYRVPLTRTFCQELFEKLRPESAALWLSDSQGTELSAGLALSLRDFARLGQLLIDARNSNRRHKVPNWFIETLTASAGLRIANSPDLAGLRKGSEYRYGFVHLGGAPNRIAILGPYGNSLYVDFDRRLVIAIFAAYPRKHSAGMRATLEQVWDMLGSATQPSGKR